MRLPLSSSFLPVLGILLLRRLLLLNLELLLELLEAVTFVFGLVGLDLIVRLLHLLECLDVLLLFLLCCAIVMALTMDGQLGRVIVMLASLRGILAVDVADVAPVWPRWRHRRGDRRRRWALEPGIWAIFLAFGGAARAGRVHRQLRRGRMLEVRDAKHEHEEERHMAHVHSCLNGV